MIENHILKKYSFHYFDSTTFDRYSQDCECWHRPIYSYPYLVNSPMNAWSQSDTDCLIPEKEKNN
jgi:hypothetical protein